MASEYLKWKYRDVQPDAPIEYTPAQKRANWWYYHRWHVGIGILLLLAAANIAKNVLRIGVIQPDYQIAYAGRDPLPEESVLALESAIAALGCDANKDGQVLVKIHQYASHTSEEEDSQNQSLPAASQNPDNYMYEEASRVALISDMTSCDSFFFIIDSCETFQRDYQILSYTDGSLPSDWAIDYDRMGCAWADCPVLTNLDLGSFTEVYLGEEVTGSTQDLFSHLTIARRGFWTSQTCANLEACEELWNNLTKGYAGNK